MNWTGQSAKRFHWISLAVQQVLVWGGSYHIICLIVYFIGVLVAAEKIRGGTIEKLGHFELPHQADMDTFDPNMDKNNSMTGGQSATGGAASGGASTGASTGASAEAV